MPPNDTIPTSILMLSDTHGLTFGDDGWVRPARKFDVAIHCGDLTQESKLEEFSKAINLLSKIDAAVKLIIAGNHELTLDEPVFKEHLAAAGLKEDDEEVVRAYGSLGQARAMLVDAAKAGNNIMVLDEGTHTIPLQNGAILTVFASPFTPRKEALGVNEPSWAFQYNPATGSEDDRVGGHKYDIQSGTDIVITHGPPLGILDQGAGGKRAGCADLFAAVCRARPLLHCFGHIHGGWGARRVAWRETTSKAPSHFTDIDNNHSAVLEKLANLRRGPYDDDEAAAGKSRRLEEYRSQGFSLIPADERPAQGKTMFVNAAIEGSDQIPVQPAFAVELDLPRA